MSDAFIPLLYQFYFSVTPDITEFCLGEFITEIRFATQHVNLTSEEFIKFEGNIFSTVIKLFYAFLWQVFYLNTYLHVIYGIYFDTFAILRKKL